MKAVICGAGIAGLAAARQLAVLGWEVVVLEKAPGPRTQGYMIDFFGAGYDAAEAMGLLPRLRELGYQVYEARFVDETGRRRARISFERFARSVDGRMLSIMRPDLELALRENLPDAVDLRFSTSLTHIEDRTDEVLVTLTDGTVVSADLLVGADGIHSTVRALVFGEERTYLRHLGFHTAAFTFTDPAIHAEVRDRFHLTDTVGRQAGLYALRDGRVATFMVHTTDDPTLPDDPRSALRAVYGSMGWVVPAMLAACPPNGEVYYDQVAQVVLPSWRRGRVVLAGDAAYAVSLLAGQGASLGIAGAYVLAEQLRRAGSIEDALARYESVWRPVAEEKQATGRRAARWFLPRNALELRLRRLMLAMARLPGLDGLVAGRLGGKHTAIVRELARSRQDLEHLG